MLFKIKKLLPLKKCWKYFFSANQREAIKRVSTKNFVKILVAEGLNYRNATSIPCWHFSWLMLNLRKGTQHCWNSCWWTFEPAAGNHREDSVTLYINSLWSNWTLYAQTVVAEKQLQFVTAENFVILEEFQHVPHLGSSWLHLSRLHLLNTSESIRKIQRRLPLHSDCSVQDSLKWLLFWWQYHEWSLFWHSNDFPYVTRLEWLVHCH